MHFVAALTALATFPLIFAGGLVTSHGVGLSVPDWPNSYGYNMFLFPPNKWIGGIFYEHTHRLMGTVVGFLSIILVMMAWGPARNLRARRWIGRAAIVFTVLAIIVAGLVVATHRSLDDPLNHVWVGFLSLAAVATVAWRCRRPHSSASVRWLCAAVFVAVCIQGGLGGQRVNEISLALAIVHGAFAQAVFCLMVLTAIVTSSWWSRQTPPFIWLRQGRTLVMWTIVLAVLVYCQLIAGALMRHLGAGLAIPDLPLAYGHWLPPISEEGLDRINSFQVRPPELDRVTLTKVWLHFAHRIGAVVVSVIATGVIGLVVARRRTHKRLVAKAVLLAVLLVTQLTLGVFTVLLRKPADVATLHVACGALVLATAFAMAVMAVRLYWPRLVTVDQRPAWQQTGVKESNRFATV